MDIRVREMTDEEAKAVKKLGRKAFSLIEGLWIGTPKNALVAVKDNEIVGALLYKFYHSGGKKIGYVDYVFTDPRYHGMGIGKLLYRESIAFMWAKGCDALTALVKDDNAASWSLFIQNQFTRVSIPDLIREFGFFGTIRQYFTMPYLAIGMDYYLCLKDRTCPSGKSGSIKQLLAFLLVNLVLGLTAYIRFPNPLPVILAYGCVLCGVTAAEFIGTLFSRRKWAFRFLNGGAVISLLANLFSFLPMIGRWHPVHYENTPGFKRDMGISALTGWLFTLALPVLTFLPIVPAGSFIGLLGLIGLIFSIYRCIPIYPMESYGGARVFTWSRKVFSVLTILTLVIFAVTFFL